jgi:hypothetical protein
MKLMAAAMQTQGGSRSTARAVYRQMLADSEDPMIRTTSERRLQNLDSLDQRDAIDKALNELKERAGKCPNSLSEIIPMLMPVKLPEGNEFQIDNAGRLVDPTGAPYLLNRENCRVQLDPEKTGLPLK